MKIVVTRKLPGNVLSILFDSYDVFLWEKDKSIDREVLLNEVKDADGIICLLSDKIDREVIESAKNLKVISVYAAGYDNIDVEFATKKGIAVTNVPGVLTETTADLAFGIMMAAARRIVEGVEVEKEGSWNGWSPTLLLGMDVYGKTIGIIGMGRIGKAVAKRAKGFDMEILYYSRKRKEDVEETLGARFVSLEELLKLSDFVVITASLNESTQRMIGEKELKTMKKSAILVNVGRGKIVDTDALYKALKDGWIWAAALDVTDPEPLPKDHPLLSLKNVVITPHIGSATYETREKMAEVAVENLLAVLEGKKPKFIVNPEVLA